LLFEREEHKLIDRIISIAQHQLNTVLCYLTCDYCTLIAIQCELRYSEVSLAIRRDHLSIAGRAARLKFICPLYSIAIFIWQKHPLCIH